MKCLNLMKPATTRSILRWLHVLLSIPILGYIYGPVASISEASFATRFVFLPFVVLSGLWMWKGPWIRRKLSAGFPMLVALAIAKGSSLQAAEPDAAVPQELRGMWQATALEVHGQSAPAMIVEGFRVEFTGDKMIIKKRTSRTDLESVVKVNAATSPKSLDLTSLSGPRKGQTTLGIYSLQGDVLKICTCEFSNDPRPTEFSTRENDRLGVMTLRRMAE